MAGLVRDPSDLVAIRHEHQGTAVEVFDGHALTARGARVPAIAPATIPSPWAAASPCASASELEPRPCHALGSSLSLTQISTGGKDGLSEL